MTGRRRRPNAFQRALAEHARRREEKVDPGTAWQDDTQVIPALRDETQVISAVPLTDVAPMPASVPAHHGALQAGGRSGRGDRADHSRSDGRARSEARNRSDGRAGPDRRARSDGWAGSDGRARSDADAPSDVRATADRRARSDAARRPGGPAVADRAARNSSGGDGQSDALPPPLYARALFLRNLHPGPVLCFLFFEGAIATGAVFALAGKVTPWAAVVLPATVAAVVKLNDVVAGSARRRAAARARVAPARDVWPELRQPVASDPVKEAHMEWRRGLRSEVTTRLPPEGYPYDGRSQELPRDW